MKSQYSIGNFTFDTPEEFHEASEELKKVRSIYQNYDTKDPVMAARIVELYENGELPFTTSIGLAFVEKMRENAEAGEGFRGEAENHSGAEAVAESPKSAGGVRRFFDSIAAFPGKVRDKIEDIWYEILLFFDEVKNFWTKTVLHFWTVIVPGFWKEKIIGFITFNREREILFIIGAVVIVAAGIIVPITYNKAFGPKPNQAAIIDSQISQINDAGNNVEENEEIVLPSEWVPEIGKYEGKVPNKEYMYDYVNAFLTWTALQYIYTNDPALEGITIQEAIPIAAYSLCSECMSLVDDGKEAPFWAEYNAQERTVFIETDMIEQRCFDLFGSNFCCDDFDINASHTGIYPGEDGKYFIFLGTWGEFEPDFEIYAVRGGQISKDFRVIVRYKKYSVQSGTLDPEFTFSVTYSCTKSDLSKYGFIMEDMSGKRK